MNRRLLPLVIVAVAVGSFADLIRRTRSQLVWVTVAGESMAPTLSHGSRLLAYTGSTVFKEGDVVVLETPNWIRGTAGDLLVKRVTAVGGQQANVSSDRRTKSSSALQARSGEGVGAEALVGEGELFVVGDNPSASFDSHEFGPIATSSVKGKVLLAISGSGFRSQGEVEEFVQRRSAELLRFETRPSTVGRPHVG